MGRRQKINPWTCVDEVIADPLPLGEATLLVHALMNCAAAQGRPYGNRFIDGAVSLACKVRSVFGAIDLGDYDETTLKQREQLLHQQLSETRANTRPARRNALDTRVDWLGRLIGLDPLERAIAALSVRQALYPQWEALLDKLGGARGRNGTAIIAAAILGARPGEVIARLEPHRLLIASGLIDRSDDDHAASDFLKYLGAQRTTDPARLAARLLKSAPPSTLGWDDFAHLGGAREMAFRLIGAGAKRRAPVDLLLHGEPGTGKTEFARTLADRLGLSAIFVGLEDDVGGEPTRLERIAHLTAVRALTRRSSKHLIVVDEAEDLMQPTDGRGGTSKLWLNRLIESSTGPTVWIVNCPERLGRPVVRRMTSAIAFAQPPLGVRRRVIMRHADAKGVIIAGDTLNDLAALDVPPAVASHAMRAAALMKGDGATALGVAKGLHEALNGPSGMGLPSTSVPFDPALSRADTDLANLARQLVETPERRWSLLLEGPSGTGKSAFARYLAEICGMQLIEKRASDLLDKYVGVTEQKIAAAFAEAAAEPSLLLFDEADSMLRNRQLAERSWEVSQVNEMLTAMERHPYPFVATTNLADTLDPATQRRFLFRVRFEPLDGLRLRMLWRSHFGDEAPTSLPTLDGLTPSDFAVVARRLAITGEVSIARRLAMLEKEAADKPGARAVLGFAPSVDSCAAGQ